MGGRKKIHINFVDLSGRAPNCELRYPSWVQVTLPTQNGFLKHLQHRDHNLEGWLTRAYTIDHTHRKNYPVAEKSDTNKTGARDIFALSLKKANSGYW
jgi:hypothetical protein